MDGEKFHGRVEYKSIKKTGRKMKKKSRKRKEKIKGDISNKKNKIQIIIISSIVFSLDPRYTRSNQDPSARLAPSTHASTTMYS